MRKQYLLNILIFSLIFIFSVLTWKSIKQTERLEEQPILTFEEIEAAREMFDLPSWAIHETHEEE